MKFFLDHDVRQRIREVLERHEHTVYQAKDVLPTTASDEAVFGYAIQHDFIMITCNRNDFLDLASYMTHRGLIILVRRPSGNSECMKLMQLIQRAGEGGLVGNVNFA